MTNIARGDSSRIFSIVDRWFFLFMGLELVAFPFVPFLPLGFAVLAFATALRRSRWRMAVLLTLGGIFALIVAAPFVLGLLGVSSLTHLGPVRTVSP